MKLSQYAKKVGVTYRTAFRWWQNGDIKGYQLPSGTIVVTEGEERQESRTGQVVIYARVSSHAHRANLERQAERLEDYCAAKGYQVSRVVKEIGSGVHDNRAKFLALLEDQRIHTIVVEQKEGWLLFEPTNEYQKRFAPPLVMEIRCHIREEPF